MSVAFLPFTSLLLNQYFGSVSVIFYAPSMAATGLLLGMLWIYPARRRLLRNVEARLNRYYTLRALYPPADLPAIPVAVAAPRQLSTPGSSSSWAGLCFGASPTVESPGPSGRPPHGEPQHRPPGLTGDSPMKRALRDYQEPVEHGRW